MLKKSLGVLILFFCSIALLKAQPPVHVPLMTNVWKLIAEKEYRKNAQFKMMPFYPAKLKALHNKVIELPGYFIPLKAESASQEFMLAVVPYDQCAYCGQGDIPSMVEVRSKTPIAYSEKPIKIKGKLVLNESGDSRSEIFVMEAELVK